MSKLGPNYVLKNCEADAPSLHSYIQLVDVIIDKGNSKPEYMEELLQF